MNVKENMAAVWGEFVKRVLSKEIRQERTGKHRAGNHPKQDARASLLKHRKAERQARRYARMYAAGKKHRT